MTLQQVTLRYMCWYDGAFHFTVCVRRHRACHVTIIDRRLSIDAGRMRGEEGSSTTTAHTHGVSDVITSRNSSHITFSAFIVALVGIASGCRCLIGANFLS